MATIDMRRKEGGAAVPLSRGAGTQLPAKGAWAIAYSERERSLKMIASKLATLCLTFDFGGEFSGCSYPVKTAEIWVRTDRVHIGAMAITTEPSVCDGDAALCQISLTTCSACYSRQHRYICVAFIQE